MWGRQELSWFMVFITIVTGAYKPTYILGASHCTICLYCIYHFCWDLPEKKTPGTTTTGSRRSSRPQMVAPARQTDSALTNGGCNPIYEFTSISTGKVMINIGLSYVGCFFHVCPKNICGLYEKHDDKPWKFLMINIGFCPCFSPMYFLTNPFETRWGRSGHHHLTFRGRSWGSQGWFQGNLTRNNGFYNYRIHIICIYIYISLVVDLPLWKIWKSVGMIIPNIWRNKTCLKPPTIYIYIILYIYILYIP